jgi:hypothetical protein
MWFILHTSGCTTSLFSNYAVLRQLALCLFALCCCCSFNLLYWHFYHSVYQKRVIYHTITSLLSRNVHSC